MERVDHTSPCAATRHIARAVSLLNRAEHHLSAARSTASNRFQREQLHRLTCDLRSIRAPLARISSALESGCHR
jgi:hypothetical protein